MVKNKAPITVDAISSDGLSVTITQQALNVLRQIVANQGWITDPATLVQDMFVSGKLLVETLPQLDSVAWVQSEEEIKAMSPKEREAYVARDKAWTTKQVTFQITEGERLVIQRAFQHFAATAASAKQLGPNVHLFEIISNFKIRDKEVVDEAVKPVAVKGA